MKIIAYAVFFINLFSCVTKPLNRVEVHSNCGFVDPVDNSNDALADMNLFVMKIEEPLRKEKINLERTSKTDFCGFVFSNGERVEKIEGVHTDQDLKCRIGSFFGNKNLREHCSVDK